jgi:hypothetical protein
MEVAVVLLPAVTPTLALTVAAMLVVTPTLAVSPAMEAVAATLERWSTPDPESRPGSAPGFERSAARTMQWLTWQKPNRTVYEACSGRASWPRMDFDSTWAPETNPAPSPAAAPVATFLS